MGSDAANDSMERRYVVAEREEEGRDIFVLSKRKQAVKIIARAFKHYRISLRNDFRLTTT